jgi:hypothetical protein
MEKVMMQIPYSFLRDLQKASATLEIMLEECEDAQEAMNLFTTQCDIERILQSTKIIDGRIAAYIYERR